MTFSGEPKINIAGIVVPYFACVVAGIGKGFHGV